MWQEHWGGKESQEIIFRRVWVSKCEDQLASMSKGHVE